MAHTDRWVASWLPTAELRGRLRHRPRHRDLPLGQRHRRGPDAAGGQREHRGPHPRPVLTSGATDQRRSAAAHLDPPPGATTMTAHVAEYSTTASSTTWFRVARVTLLRSTPSRSPVPVMASSSPKIWRAPSHRVVHDVLEDSTTTAVVAVASSSTSRGDRQAPPTRPKRLHQRVDSVGARRRADHPRRGDGHAGAVPDRRHRHDMVVDRLDESGRLTRTAPPPNCIAEPD